MYRYILQTPPHIYIFPTHLLFSIYTHWKIKNAPPLLLLLLTCVFVITEKKKKKKKGGESLCYKKHCVGVGIKSLSFFFFFFLSLCYCSLTPPLMHSSGHVSPFSLSPPPTQILSSAKIHTHSSPYIFILFTYISSCYTWVLTFVPCWGLTSYLPRSWHLYHTSGVFGLVVYMFLWAM